MANDSGFNIRRISFAGITVVILFLGQFVAFGRFLWGLSQESKEALRLCNEIKLEQDNRQELIYRFLILEKEVSNLSRTIKTVQSDLRKGTHD